MKYYNIYHLSSCMIVMLLLFSACSDETGITSDSSPDIDPKIIEKVNALELNAAEIKMDKMMFPDGTFEERINIEGDIDFTVEDLLGMELYEGIDGEQYRTYNLVSSPTTINVIGFTGGGGNGLSSRMRTALQWAVNNYNRLNTGLNFTLTFGTNYTPYDMVVYRVPNGAAGGRAGFPSGGRPYKWIQIYSGMDRYNTNVVEHVITHEMGHAVGLRHTDWFSRQSCGQTGEPANPDGAVHIPGTPTGFDPTSIMLSCFGGDEDGEFNSNDITALEYLY